MSDIDLVVKIGGSTLGSHDTTIKDLIELQKQGYKIVVVHGGGNVISEWMGKQTGGWTLASFTGLLGTAPQPWARAPR